MKRFSARGHTEKPRRHEGPTELARTPPPVYFRLALGWLLRRQRPARSLAASCGTGRSSYTLCYLLFWLIAVGVPGRLAPSRTPPFALATASLPHSSFSLLVSRVFFALVLETVLAGWVPLLRKASLFSHCQVTAVRALAQMSKGSFFASFFALFLGRSRLPGTLGPQRRTESDLLRCPSSPVWRRTAERARAQLVAPSVATSIGRFSDALRLQAAMHRAVFCSSIGARFGAVLHYLPLPPRFPAR